MPVKFTLLLPLLGALFLFAAPRPAHAEWQSFDCQSGEYLVGFKANTGVWVDRIAGVCGHWNGTRGLIDSTHDGPLLATSTGGAPRPPALCPATAAVKGMLFDLPFNNGVQVLENVALYCQDLAEPHAVANSPPQIWNDGTGRDDDRVFGAGLTGDDPKLNTSCGADQTATGFDADVAQYVGNISLHCAPWPAKPSLRVARMGRGLAEAVPAPAPAAPPPLRHFPHRAILSQPGVLWHSSEGDMHLIQGSSHIDGSYGTDGGRFSADLVNGKYWGQWAEDSSGHKCNTPELDSYYWGRIVWTFKEDGSGFVGGWSYCDAPPELGAIWQDRAR